jgi:predicted RNA binding protein YcfA (HicA-like mRNA interferase family)
LAKDYYPEIVKILKNAGWVVTSGGKGSHEKWQKSGTNQIVVVPRSKSRHTANEVLKQAGLPKAF